MAVNWLQNRLITKNDLLDPSPTFPISDNYTAACTTTCTQTIKIASCKMAFNGDRYIFFGLSDTTLFMLVILKNRTRKKIYSQSCQPEKPISCSIISSYFSVLYNRLNAETEKKKGFVGHLRKGDRERKKLWDMTIKKLRSLDSDKNQT